LGHPVFSQIIRGQFFIIWSARLWLGLKPLWLNSLTYSVIRSLKWADQEPLTKNWQTADLYRKDGKRETTEPQLYCKTGNTFQKLAGFAILTCILMCPRENFFNLSRPTQILGLPQRSAAVLITGN